MIYCGVHQVVFDARAEFGLACRDMPRQRTRDAINARAANDRAAKLTGVVQRLG
jgi:hypothetical protein